MDNCFVIVDFGSSTVRTLAVTLTGRIIKSVTTKCVADFPGPNLSEYNAQELFTLHKQALDTLLEHIKTSHTPIAIGITAQRSTVFFWDKQTFEPLAPALSWQDGRAKEISDSINLSQKEIHALTGLYKTPYYAAPKIKWMLENNDNVKKAEKENRLCAGPFTSYFVYRITQGKYFICDPSQAQRTLLFNIVTSKWDENLLKIYNIKPEILPQIVSSQGDFGHYNGIPIVCTIGDQQASCIGSGIGPGKCVINYGTGAFVFVSTNKLSHIDGILTSVAWQRKNNEMSYLLEGALNSASSAYNWLNQLGIEFDHSAIDELCRKSRNPVSFLPALGGLGAPYWDFNVQTVISGFKPYTRKEDMVCGLTNGIGFLIADIINTIRKTGVSMEEIIAGGGLSACKYLLELQTSLANLPLLRKEVPEATALGCASVLADYFDMDYSKWDSLTNTDVIMPSLSNSDANAAYAKWHEFLDKAKLI